MIEIFAELRRRKVFRAAIAYAIAAWVIIQIADVIFDPLHLPEWALTLLIAVVAAGFPLVVVVAWLFDLGPEGLERDTAGQADTATAAAPARHSVAVLPFADLSPDGDQAYFCDGIVEEIINTLARVGGLDVASRWSTQRFRGQPVGVQDVGRELDVAWVLEGTVRKNGDRLRVTAQLSDTASGYHIWSQRFDRQMSDVFAIQDEIAGSIAGEMQLELRPGDRCSAQEAGTANSDAYDLYLKAWSYFHRWGARNIAYAAELFQSAIDRDPGYARAWAGLADAYATLYIYIDAKPEYRDLVRDASMRALAICPRLPESHVSRGLSCTMYADWPAAERHFTDALELDPEHFEALYFYARACVHQGKTEQAIALFERAAAARPEDYQSLLLLQQLHKRIGNRDAATAAGEAGIAKAERHLEMNPDDVRALYLMSGPLADLGQQQRGEQVLLRAMAIDPTDPAVQYNAACFYARIGDQDRAVELLEKVKLPELAADWVQHDPDLALLRGHPRFDELYPA